jgi:TolB protein
MRTDTAGDDIRDLLRLLADEVPQENSVPPEALGRAKKRLIRNGVIAVVVLTVAAFGTLSGVEALRGAERTTPAVNPTHGPTQVSNGRIAFVSSDAGAYVYNAKEHSYEATDYLYTVVPDGSDVRLAADTQAEHPDWSPDGSTIAFDSGRVWLLQDGFPAPWWTESGHIFTVHADGTGLTQVTSGDGAEFAPDWSPDGTHRAVAAREGPGISTRIFILDLATEQMRPITEDQAAYVDMEPDYSPDGTQIVFVRQGVSSELSALFVVNLDGSGLRQLTPWELDAIDPSWSPDGTTILFQSGDNCCDDPLAEVYVIGADGTSLTLLSSVPVPTSPPSFPPLPASLRKPTRAASFQPSWSPDGTRIVFTQRVVATSAPLQLLTMAPDGGDVTVLGPLTPKDNWEDAAWGTHP